MTNGTGTRFAEWPRLRWSGGTACAWSLLFAALHFFWAAGGRAGLGAQEAAADQAFRQSWFIAYNFAVGVLALTAGVAAIILAWRPSGCAGPVLRIGAWVACAVLLVRGVVGAADMALRLGTANMDSPLLLVLIEPGFVLGGLLFGALALKTVSLRVGREHSRPSPGGTGHG